MINNSNEFERKMASEKIKASIMPEIDSLIDMSEKFGCTTENLRMFRKRVMEKLK